MGRTALNPEFPVIAAPREGAVALGRLSDFSMMFTLGLA